MTPMELAREVFPDADEAFLDHAIWGKTGFPAFWSLKPGQTVEDRMREQLIAFRDGIAKCPEGKFMCDFCNDHFVDEGQWVCRACDWNVPCFDETEL